jgi:hypothetical protein
MIVRFPLSNDEVGQVLTNKGFVVAVGRRFLRKELKVVEKSEVWLACRRIGHPSFKP